MENKTYNLQEAKKAEIDIRSKFLNKVVEYASYSNELMTEQQKSNVLSLFADLKKQMDNVGVKSLAQIDMDTSNYIEQVKKWSRLNLNAEDKLFTDIRFNSKTNKYNVNIRAQYQALEKIMVLYCKLPIVRFKGDVICIGDDLKTEEDFENGVVRIISHTRNNDIDRNKYENITGAYKIAYVDNGGGKLTPITVIIDKNRIDRARRAAAATSPSWKNDVVKMVKKTATFELFNSDLIRPFIEYPSDIVANTNIIEESEELNWNKETTFNSVEQVQEQAQEQIGTEKVELDLPKFDEFDDSEEF